MPAQLALPGVHEAVLDCVSGLSPCAALDLPAGPGALTQALLERGFDVTSADVDPSRFDVSGHRCDAVDFEGTLPYPDDAFGLVVCAEGLEHAENAYHVVRELSRVLAPGGTLVLSTPNPLNLASRVRALLTGFSDVSPRPIRSDEARLSNHHINPIRLQFLELMLRRNGLQIRSVSANRMRTSAMLVAVLLGPWIWLATWWALRPRSRPEPMPQVHADVRRMLLSPPVLFGRVVVVQAEKPPTA